MRWLAIVLLPLLAACGSASDKPATTPALNAQPITYMDIEAAKLTGPSCNYAAGKSMAAVVMAMDDAAVMKLGGALKRFTLDPQCDKPATTPALNAQPITYMDIEVAKLTGPSCNTPRARAWARW